MRKTLRILIVFLLFFLAINAIGGGLFLIIDASGKTLGIPVDLLDNTHFNDYLIPGIILFLANGILSLIVAILTIKQNKNFEWFIILQGCVLIGWLTIEIILNKEFFLPILHYPLYSMGIIFVISGLFLMKREFHDI